MTRQDVKNMYYGLTEEQYYALKQVVDHIGFAESLVALAGASKAFIDMPHESMTGFLSTVKAPIETLLNELDPKQRVDDGTLRWPSINSFELLVIMKALRDGSDGIPTLTIEVVSKSLSGLADIDRNFGEAFDIWSRLISAGGEHRKTPLGDAQATVAAKASRQPRTVPRKAVIDQSARRSNPKQSGAAR